MTQNFTKALVIGAMTVGLAGVGGGLGGCKGGGLGGLGGLMGQPDAMSLLSPLVKDAANSYVGGLGSLTSMLSGVKGWQDALKLVEKIQPTINQVGEAYSTLASTSGADRANLLKAFGPKINSANSSFLGQSNRIQNDSLMGKALGTALEQVKLFK